MKKTLRIFLVAMVAIVLATGSAFAASTLNIVDASGPSTQNSRYVFGSEWLAGQAGNITVDFGSAIPSPAVAAEYLSTVTYTPGIDLGIDNTLTFAVTNGAIAPNVAYGLWDAGTAAKVADLVDFTVDGSNNYVTMLFKLTTAVPTGTVLTLTSDGTAPTNLNDVVVVTPVTTLKSSSVYLSVPSAKDGTGQPLVAPIANPIQLVATLDQLSATVSSVATDTIDVEQNRMNFVGPVDLSAAVTVNNVSVNQGIDIATTAYTLTLDSTQAGISAVTFNDGTNGLTAMTLASGVWTTGATDVSLMANAPINISVTGTTVLDPAAFTVSLTLNPAEAGVSSVNAINQSNAFIWSINAMQAKVPYFILNAHTGGYYSFIKVVNESANAADMTIDAVIYNFTDGVDETPMTNVAITSIPAYSNTTVSDDQIATALGLDPAKIYHVALTATVVAPQNNIQLSAYQKDSVGRTAIPVLFDMSSARNWYQ